LDRTFWPTADLQGGLLEGANLFEAVFESADFSGARLEGAFLRHARLESAIFRFAMLQGADLAFAQLEGAVFSGAQMESALLHGADMERVVLSGAKMGRADLSQTNMQKADLSFAQLERANFSFAQMQGADLTGAQLEGAILDGVRMKGAVLNGSHLVGFVDRLTLLQFSNLNAAVNEAGALRYFVLSNASWDSKTDFRSAFLDGSVVVASDFRARMGDPCQWVDRQVETDAEFYSLWRWWLKQTKNDDILRANKLPNLQVPDATPELLAKYGLTDCKPGEPFGPMPD